MLGLLHQSQEPGPFELPASCSTDRQAFLHHLELLFHSLWLTAEKGICGKMLKRFKPQVSIFITDFHKNQRCHLRCDYS